MKKEKRFYYIVNAWLKMLGVAGYWQGTDIYQGMNICLLFIGIIQVTEDVL